MIAILSETLTGDKAVYFPFRKTMFRAVATAVYSYTAEAEDELSFEKDDCVYIKSTKGGHWWYGVHKGRSGCVPKKYLKLQVLASCKVTRSFVPRKPEDLQLLEGNLVDVLIKEKQEWYGRIKDSEGWFPPDHVIEITQSTQEKPKPAPEPTTSSRFDEITSKALLLEDVRKQRPRKPSAGRQRVSIEEENEDFEDAQEPLYDTPKPKEEEIQPKKMEHQEPAWLTELKQNKLKLNKTKSIDLIENAPPLDKNKSAAKSTPNLTSDVPDSTKKISKRMSVFLHSPKPFTPQNANKMAEVVKSIRSNVSANESKESPSKSAEVVKSTRPSTGANEAKNTQQEQVADASRSGQMAKNIELLTESPKRDLEQRVELLEKLVIAMTEQLTDMRKDLMKLKSMELQKIVPF